MATRLRMPTLALVIVSVCLSIAVIGCEESRSQFVGISRRYDGIAAAHGNRRLDQADVPDRGGIDQPFAGEICHQGGGQDDEVGGELRW